MQRCQDLAGSGEKLFFTVLASLKLSLMTIECINDKTSVLTWLLPSAASALPDERRKFSRWYWHPQCRSAPTKQSWNSSQVFFFFLVCLCFVLFFKTLLKQLKLLNIKGTKAIPLGSTDGSDSFQAHTSLCLRTKLHREQRGHRLPFASNFRLLLRRNVWPCVPAKRGLQKLADLI